MKVDLHLHTSASDGTWDPERLLAEVQKKEIGVFAVTDHDTVVNTLIVRGLAQDAGLYYVNGVEISATLENNLFHILGYNIDPADPELNKLLQHNTRLMEEKDDVSIKVLIENGYQLDYNKYQVYQNDNSRGGWKALNFLIDEGICRDPHDYFCNIFNEQNKLFFPVFPSPQEVIAAIAKAGGIPVLAHPAVSANEKFTLEEILEVFLELGIEGIECYHPQHDHHSAGICLKWAQKNGLQITGGSDCHGDFICSRQLGLPEIHFKQLILDKIISI